MKKKIAIIIVATVLVVFFIFIILPKEEEEKASESFARCLTEKGAKMYGTEWCSHCKAQKEKFGESFEFIDYIDCDMNKDMCNVEKISGYPTWKIMGQSFPGGKTLEELSELSGCTL